MNKRNKDLLKISRLLKKLIFFTFATGVSGLKKPFENIYLHNMRQVDSNLYIWKSDSKAIIGFKTFYCGVNAFVPNNFKKYWISDHHIMSVYYRIGMQSLSIVPYNGELYTMQFRRTSVPWNCEIDAIHAFLSKFILLDGINQWIDLFYSNNDEKIIVEQGFMFPEFKLINRDFITDIVKLYQMQFGIKKVGAAREKLACTIEKTLSLIIAG